MGFDGTVRGGARTWENYFKGQTEFGVDLGAWPSDVSVWFPRAVYAFTELHGLTTRVHPVHSAAGNGTFVFGIKLKAAL